MSQTIIAARVMCGNDTMLLRRILTVLFCCKKNHAGGFLQQTYRAFCDNGKKKMYDNYTDKGAELLHLTLSKVLPLVIKEQLKRDDSDKSKSMGSLTSGIRAHIPVLL